MQSPGQGPRPPGVLIDGLQTADLWLDAQGIGVDQRRQVFGDAVEAEEALGIGLVNKVAADDSLAEEARAFAEQLVALPTAALGRMKTAIYASFEADLETALDREAEGQTFCGYTQDHKEGVAAFFEKREPKFTGR